jgi:hypothetical protein
MGGSKETYSSHEEFIVPNETFSFGRNWHLGFSRLPEGLRACLSPLLYKSSHWKKVKG